MAGCPDDYGILSVGDSQECVGHFAQDVAAAVCFSDNDALRYNRGVACQCGHLLV